MKPKLLNDEEKALLWLAIGELKAGLNEAVVLWDLRKLAVLSDVLAKHVERLRAHDAALTLENGKKTKELQKILSKKT